MKNNKNIILLYKVSLVIKLIKVKKILNKKSNLYMKIMLKNKKIKLI